MAIEFILGDECPVKNCLSVDGMLDLLKKRNMAQSAIKTLVDSGMPYEKALDFTFTFNRIVPGGQESQERTVSELLNEVKKLEELSSHCGRCNLPFGKEFGCYFCINLPISLKAEKWLLDMAMRSIENEDDASRMVVDFIIDQEVTGDRFQELRVDQSGTFLESKEAPEFLYDQKRSVKRYINTNQLLEVLFMESVIERSQQMAFLYFTGCFKILRERPDTKMYRRIVELENSKGESFWFTFDLKNEEDDDLSITQLKEYFHMIFIAFCSGNNVFVDF